MIKKRRNIIHTISYIVTMICFVLLITTMYNTKLAKAKSEKVTFDDGKLTYQITDEKTYTVELVGSLRNITDTKLVIPSKVTYKGASYTVTSIDYDSEGYYNESVTEIDVPDTIVGDVVIRNSEMTDQQYETNDPDTDVPFIALHKMVFTAKSIPDKIQVQAYLYDSDFIVEVPAGQEQLYEQKIGNFRLLAIAFYDRVDQDHEYYTYEVPPIILSSIQKTYEPHVFNTPNGIYLVTKSGKDGQGEAKLIKCLKLITKESFTANDSGAYHYPVWNDDTIETNVTSGGYQYTVTSLAKNAIATEYPAVLTIPDTITQMDTPCINSMNLKALFLSNSCKNISGRLFITGEYDDHIPLVYIPSSVESVNENIFYGTHVGKVVLPSNITLSSVATKRVDTASPYTINDTDIKATGLDTVNKTISATVMVKKQLEVNASNANSTDRINYASMDNGTALVSAKGELTPAHYGTGFVVAYSVLSGKHQILKINVKDKTFTSGIFTYRINYSTKKSVTLIGCKPSKKTTAISIPSKVKYKGVNYSVTKVCAGKSIIDENAQWYYTTQKGYIRTYDYDAPLILDSVAKSSKVTQITIPSTVTTIVSNLGNLPKLKKVVFAGKKAPKIIAISVNNLKKATLYIPKYSLSSFKKSTYRFVDGNSVYLATWSKECIAKFKTK